MSDIMKVVLQIHREMSREVWPVKITYSLKIQ